MTTYLALAALAVAAALSLFNYRRGMFLCLVVGFFQEPIRKLVPGEPVYFTMMVGLLMATTFIGAKLRGFPLTFRPIHAWNGILRTPLNLFIAAVLVQCMVAYIITESLVIPGIGLIGYLAPLPALLLAYYFAGDLEQIYTFFKWYIILCMLMLSGIYLSRLGFDWQVLKAVGPGLRIYGNTKLGYIDLPPGFFRAPEIAAWHGGAAICLLIVLAVSRGNRGLYWLAGILIPLALMAVIFTGRRKILLEIVMFVLIYGGLLSHFRRGGAKLTAMILLLGVGGWFFATQTDYGATMIFTDINPYFDRQSSLQQNISDRFMTMTVDAFGEVIEHNGFLGSGAGTGSQGAQHFGGGGELVGSSAEGGIGKVLAELGVPGLMLFLFLLVRFGCYHWSIVKTSRAWDFQTASLVYGMTAFLAANAVIFVSAHQVFGDPFVLLMLGWLLGFTLATPWLDKEAADQAAPGN